MEIQQKIQQKMKWKYSGKYTGKYRGEDHVLLRALLTPVARNEWKLTLVCRGESSSLADTSVSDTSVLYGDSPLESSH